MKIFFKKILRSLYHIVNNNYISIFLIKKPINTWILSNIKNKKIFTKDASLWKDEKNMESKWFSKISKPDEKIFINYITKNISKENYVLDVCCNQGRFLKYLNNNGYSNLYGFDIMEPAIKILKKSKEYKEGNIKVECCLAQEYLINCPDKFFDYVITFPAAIELIHPSFKIFDQIFRITKKGFIIALAENRHYYPQFYRYLIKKARFRKINIFKINKYETLYHYEK